MERLPDQGLVGIAINSALLIMLILLGLPNIKPRDATVLAIKGLHNFCVSNGRQCVVLEKHLAYCCFVI